MTQSDGVSVAVAAARLGISEKTLLRRIKGGSVQAEKVSLPGGGLGWRVYVPESEETRAGIEPEPPRSDKTVESDTQKTNVPEVSSARAGIEKDTLLEHVLEENRFLRASLEQHQRSEAELRAALREALRAMPKQLADSGAERGIEAPGNASGGVTAHAPVEAQKTESETPEKREPRPLWKLILGVR